MSAASTFDSTKEFLSTLLRELGIGETQLPDFQRGWVWDDEHIRSLIASVGSAFPIGAVMMLEMGGDANFQPRPVQGVAFAQGATPKPKRLILDGQQRLTSLYQVTLLGKVVETQNTKKERIKRWYYLDMKKATAPDADLEDAVVGVPESRVIVNFRGEPLLDLSSPEREYGLCHFPLTNVFDYAKWRQEFNKHWHYAQAQIELFDDFDARVLEVFKSYQIPVIVLKRETPKAAVCQVFEKVNTGGVSLNAFELLTATYAADNFSLRDDWHGPRDTPGSGRRSKIHADAVLKGVQETDYLQGVTLLHTLDVRDKRMAAGEGIENAPAVSCKRVAILNLPLAGYLKWRDGATDGFMKAGRLLKLHNIFTDRDLPYQTQLVPLAAVIARIGPKWEVDGVRRKLARWYWSGVFGELYGGAVETRFANDLVDLLAWIDGAEEPRTVKEALFDPNRLSTLRTRNSAAYKGLHAILMRDGGLDFRTGDPINLTTFWEERVDIHHIFPRRWCEAANIPRRRYDSIINKTALTARTNKIIGGHAPSAYLTRLEKQAGMSPERIDEVLQTHAIMPEILRADDFDGFFLARRNALVERIATAMGKAVAGVAVTEPTTEGYDDFQDEEASDVQELDSAGI
jgi:hypothetical protein